ncbi:REP-associated tyrosine transposase [Nodosilinea sp. E11]|uniref:REP-associated tyrosine transposase n=1 Tax=Nodosilinea sp. E11 TaxID=3037479 RepID=UPI002934CA87|nr:transposase [Nodosilinea sp. E11]WOD37513.1 transposase [Nodosilinea sp. E11]
MPRPQRDLVPGEYYHLYNRGNNRQNIFFERENYLYFLKQFRYFVAEETVHVVAYCLMPNHYHVLIYLREVGLSKAMQRFTMSYTNAMNRRYGRCGSLFQGRFQTIHVDSDAYLLHLTRYIHLNPMRACLVQHPQEWEFSSYCDYVGLRRGTLPQMECVLKQVGSAEAYRRFVEAPSKGSGAFDAAIDNCHGLKRHLTPEP